MKVLVAYKTSTGNTKKVAEAIYGEIMGEKEIRPIEEVKDIQAYDLSFLGFPTHGGGPDKKTKEIIERLCTNKKKVALFVTHGAPESAPEVIEWMTKFKSAAAGADLVGFFDCTGELSSGPSFVMRLSGNKEAREWVKSNGSKGQPDETRLAKARAFARETLEIMAKSASNRS